MVHRLSSRRLDSHIGLSHGRRELQYRLQIRIRSVRRFINFADRFQTFQSRTAGCVHLILHALEYPCGRQQFFEGEMIKVELLMCTRALFRCHWRMDLSQRGMNNRPRMFKSRDHRPIIHRIARFEFGKVAGKTSRNS